MSVELFSNLSDIDKRLILFLGTANQIEGRTKFHKEIFLGKKEFGLDIDLEYVKYNYGPFSLDLNNKLVELKNKDLINVYEENFISIDSPFLGKKITYSLSENGKKEFGKLLSDSLYKEFIEISRKVILKWNLKPLKEIIDYVYSKYLNQNAKF
jgi:uncharacterized protein YwgA